ncbi:MAG: oligopeptide/dipeptide ABC transporter ATP-binding protein [Pseudonocardiaceae bacterium]
MYLGKIVELSDRNAVYSRPMHPYTVALLSAVPVLDPSGATRVGFCSPAMCPSPLNPPSACRFHRPS